MEMPSKRTLDISFKKLLLPIILWSLIAIQTVHGFVNSPKIITKDGNLVFESGFNRNITFRLSGKSRLKINDEFDIMDLLFTSTKSGRPTTNNGEWSFEEETNLRQLGTELQELRTLVNGRAGITGRVRRLQNRTRVMSQMLRRYQMRSQQLLDRVQAINTKLEKDNCQSNPCENGGTCINLFNGFMCNCNKFFEGAHCEKDVNECVLYEATDLGCQNGGQCVNQFGGFNCLCTPGWYGLHCTQRKGDCMQSSNWELCVHGTCVNTNDNNGYKCICEQGWKSNGLTPECSVDVDECLEVTNKCATKCINLPGSFTCGPCDVGLTGNGLSCRDINECELQNGGCSLQPRVPCINTYGSYHCGECPIGWFGDGRTCTREATATDQNCGNANICHPAATCMLISNTMVCSCPAGMIGNGIGANGCVTDNRTDCNSHPCLNGGTCLEQAQGASFVCACREGFLQPNCRAPAGSVCSPNPCRNGGHCSAQGPDAYTCQCANGFSGKHCDNRVGRCGGLLVGETGRLKYPEGSLYDHNAQCAWVIRTNATLVLNVTFTAFELEDASECRFDWLQLNDGRTAASQLIGRFCGTHKPKGGNLITSTNYLYLWFRSDNSTSKEGFELQWSSVAPQCGGLIEISSHGTIATPGSPGNYPKNRDCEWHLRAPNNKRIKLIFFSLAIETHDSCDYDFVKIKDSISNSLIAEYCSSAHPTPLLLPTHEAAIHFHSDAVGTDAGFQIYYSLEELIPGCGGTFTAKEGVIKAPTAVAEELLSCEYDIKLPPSQAITIEFTQLKLGPDDCIELYDVNPSDNENILQSKFCSDFQGTPADFRSLYNAVHMKYYGRIGQFELNYRTECQFRYESESDTILSPEYPNLTAIERQCAYKIITQPNTFIRVHFIDFDLRDLDEENNDDCSDNYLQFTDGLDQSTKRAYCGTNEPANNFVSQTNMLTINLKTTAAARGRGFKIEYSAVPIGLTDCGGIFTKPGHTIRLPTAANGLYLNDMKCFWIIMAPPNKAITLTWLSFNLEQTTDCQYDYVEVYENLAISEDDKPLGRFCDGNLPTSFTSHSNVITIKFVSDATDAASGFEASYDFIDINSYCGQIYGSTGTLTSPNWPLNYTNSFDCTWVITGHTSTQIELTVETFELEESENCANDYLEIRNGGSNRSALIGNFCGQKIPRRIPSLTNQFYVHFHSDNYRNSRGFHLKWEAYGSGCGGNLYGKRGVITSPNYPNAYPNDAVCDWYVHVPQGSSINFTIEDLELESLFQCNYDSLEIFDGRTDGEATLTKVCHLDENSPLSVSTTSNTALVRLKTDSTNSERGFSLSYYTDCFITLTKTYGAIESPNYGGPYYRDDVLCRWTIRAPKGNQIAVEITHFDNYDGSDNIYFLEPQANGTSTPHVITRTQAYNTTGNELIIFQNSSVVSFRMEYTMVGCIAVFHKETGAFQSPGFPKWYPNNIECLWEIVGPRGQSIELTITDMNIEESVNCTKDALIISSQSTNHHHPKERHCGNQNSLIQTSGAHHLYIRFQSDAEHNGNGFEASYRIVDSTCGGLFMSRNGIVQSPNYPMNYPANVDCEWTIQVTEHHTITLTMEELDVENSFECQFDYVEAREGQNDQIELFKLCQQENSDDRTQWTTTSNSVTIHFKSDDSSQFKGFKLSYKENCGQRIVLADNDANLIDVRRSGAENETCVWQLVAEDPTKHVSFAITNLQLSPAMDMQYHSEADCLDIGGKLYDGESSNSSVRVKFCKQHPPTVISNGHALTVTVPMNVISEFEAFYQIMDNYCGNYLDAISGKLSSPYYPSTYPVDIECEWFIIPTSGNSIVLTLESLDLENSEGCNNDYLEIREENVRGHLFGVYCGSTIPPPIKSNGSLWLRFRSINDVVGNGFVAAYNYEMHNDLTGIDGTIKSPRYPSKFMAKEPYSWRIEVDKDYVVLLSMRFIVDIDIPYIKFYDGYTDIGPPIDFTRTHTVRSNTNVLFFTATRGPFFFEWERLSKEAIRSNHTAEERSKICGNELLVVNGPIVFNSPGYPYGYAPNMHCSWQFVPSNPATHVVLQLRKVDLEEMQDCLADYVRISASGELQHWVELETLCKKTELAVQIYHGKPYLKLEFISDSGVNKTGISATLKTACGSALYDRQGFVNITELRSPVSVLSADCVWTIQVRQGHRIRLSFPESIIKTPTEANSCHSYFLLRNGIAEDSPFLGKGKYCENNITDVLETSSNHAYIRFNRLGLWNFKASFRYEEISHVCSDELLLTDDRFGNQSSIITSPNYPNIPHPHTECLWLIRAPPHHVIAIEFLDQFELAPGDDCEREYVQLNDGATELMPLLGRFCGKNKPSSQYTTGNMLRLKFYTDISEPNVGFKAKVSLGRCGGTYYDNEGTIKSPERLVMRGNERQLVCVYTIEVEKGSTLRINFEKRNLPSAENCTDVTHIQLNEIETFEGVENITDTLILCGNDNTSHYLVETNKLVVVYRIKSDSSQDVEFKMHYEAVGTRCGETIEASLGLILSPGYPSFLRRPIHCSWHLKVPKGRRIKVEVLDYDLGASANASVPQIVGSSTVWHRFVGRVVFANDFQMMSTIMRATSNPPTVVYSTDNTMAIDAFILSINKHRGFKMRFTSDEPAFYCNYHFDMEQGGVLAFRRPGTTAVHCSHDLQVAANTTLVLRITNYEKYLETGHPNIQICGILSPLKLILNEQLLVPDLLCHNESMPTIRLPFSTTMQLSGNNRNNMRELDIQYAVNKCGGMLQLDMFGNATITQPKMDRINMPLECAWAVWPENAYEYDDIPGAQFVIELETDFKNDCAHQFLLIYNGPDQNSPHLARYCGQTANESVVIERGFLFEYYSSNYETQSTFKLHVKQGSGCGGQLKYPYRVISFAEQYQNNVECIWELATEPGFHLGLVFIDRFFIESSAGCTKDYLRVQQKNASNEWEDLQTICGREPPAAINTTSTEMRVIFRSDGDTTADGFTAKFERNCGGILFATDELQQISSPGYPNKYQNNLLCNYTIKPSEHNSAGVLVRFVDFDMEKAPTQNCIFDNVTIVTEDPENNVKQTVLCGRNQNYEFRAKRRISVILATDQSFNSKGFLFEYSARLCGGPITNSTSIESPHENVDSTFPPNSICIWNITAPVDYKILIKFEELDFENQMVCSYDGVEVYRGSLPIKAQRLAKFCGNLTERLPPVLSIPQNTALLRSFSDERDSSRGFRALITFIRNCDNSIYLSPENATYSFNKFAGTYDNDLDCTFLFKTTPDRQLKIEFNNFHVEVSNGCVNDYLEIRDGAGPFADMIGTFCGHEKPPNLMSSRNSLFVRFVSDKTETSAGFAATITAIPTVCGERNLKLEGNETIVIKSPRSPDGKYLKNLNCFWKITSDKPVHIKFNKMDIGMVNSNNSCEADYLKIYSTEDSTEVERGYGSRIIYTGKTAQEDYMNFAMEFIYCGNGTPNAYYSTSKEVFVKFKTDATYEGTGFELTATRIAGCYRNFTGQSGRIMLAEIADHCDIHITAPVNYTLSIYYMDMIFSEYECSQEYIEVFDAHTNSSLQKLCGYIEPGKSLFSATNELRMRIKMSSFYAQFDLTYLASNSGPGCGGNLYNSAGIFTSPYFPNHVRESSDCRWNVRVPSNLHVLIRFEQFNLGAKSTCNSDYLEIIEYAENGAEILRRRFCGEDEPKIYKSEKSYLTVRFHKTVNHDGTGWIIRFNGVYSNYVIPNYYLT